MAKFEHAFPPTAVVYIGMSPGIWDRQLAAHILQVLCMCHSSVLDVVPGCECIGNYAAVRQWGARWTY